MTYEEKLTNTRIVVDRLLERGELLNALAPHPRQLDISKPNIHDSKAEFLLEFEAVQEAEERLEKVFSTLLSGQTDDPKKVAMLARLSQAIDRSASQRGGGMRPGNIQDLIRKNKADTGFFNHSLWAMLDLILELRQRLNELEDQERQFWRVKNRPPNYYARTIALRLARLYANEKGVRPTFGTSRDGGHPSTNFGRALEEIYGILEINSDVRRAAEWAIGQLTETDFNPLRGGLLGAFSGLSGGIQNPLSAEGPTLGTVLSASEKSTEK